MGYPPRPDRRLGVFATTQKHRTEPKMSPEEFIAKWRGITRTERSAAQEHFLDLCALLGVPKPADVDRHGTEYTFEKSTRKIGDTAGFADVWKRHRFAWSTRASDATWLKPMRS